jgi:hypothetical protein
MVINLMWAAKAVITIENPTRETHGLVKMIAIAVPTE